MPKKKTSAKSHSSSSSSSSTEHKSKKEAMPCQALIKILGFKESAVVTKQNNKVCQISGTRNLGKILCTLSDQPIASNTLRSVQFSFEQDEAGTYLNMGKICVLQEEVGPLNEQAAKNDIFLSALHTDFLFTSPTVLSYHFFSSDPPIVFAQKVRRIFEKAMNPHTQQSILSSLH